jgi:hypothetical protein
LFVDAGFGGAVAGVVVGVAEPQVGVGRTRADVHQSLLFGVSMTEAYMSIRRSATKTYTETYK